MLLQRVVTAVVLLALLVPALGAGSAWPFALLTLGLIAAAVWEWGRLNRVARVPALVLGGLVFAAGVWAVRTAALERLPAAMWWSVCAVWLAIGAVVLRAGPPAWLRWPVLARVALGLLALGFGWLALTAAHRLGVNFLMSVLCLVWAADIGAYAAGRAFGRNKLAPTISPGKSWEGVAGGMLSTGVLAVAWIAVLDPRFGAQGASLYARLLESFGGLGLAVGVI
ncbi:MAG: phosphatidate cytidylyltransferase, partial [Burkholderiaceae bacterium]